MKPQKTIEEELADKDVDCDDSSVTSEALSVDSVDISSEASFPGLSARKPVAQNVQRCDLLPLYTVCARVQVRSYITSESQKLCVLEKGMTFHVLKTFSDFSEAETLEFWNSRFPDFPREQALWDNYIDGEKLGDMQVETLREVFNLNQEQAKLIRNSVRLAKRRVLAVFTLEDKVSSGWVALKKGKKLLARRIFGDCPPTLLLKNLFVSQEFSSDAPGAKHTLHRMLQKYRRENKNSLQAGTFFQNPSRTWYEETLTALLKEAGAKIKNVIWDGEFTQSLRHGSEMGKVQFERLHRGHVKSFAVQRSGFTIPNTYAFVVFRSHSDLKNFLAIDFSSFSHENSYPLHKMTAELDRTYANLSLAPVV